MAIYEKTGRLGHIASWLLVSIMFSYLGSYFHLLGASPCFAVMKRLWFIPEIITVVTMLILQSVPLSRKPKEAKLDKPRADANKLSAELPIKKD